jgi:tetrapyrrole methylase family protein/MazG family protein
MSCTTGSFNPGLEEELGDIFLLATMLAYMHEQQGQFSVADTLEGISEKLVRRHPHVFGASSGEANIGDKAGLTSKDVLQNWAKIKVEQEGRKPKDSILDEVSRGLPPLDRAWKLQKKAAKAGFDWPDITGVIAKIREELNETEAAMSCTTGSFNPGLEEELGDLLFSVVNLCRFLDIEPSVALQRTNIKFVQRFNYVETRMKENGLEMNAENLGVMDQYWNEAKGK